MQLAWSKAGKKSSNANKQGERRDFSQGRKLLRSHIAYNASDSCVLFRLRSLHMSTMTIAPSTFASPDFPRNAWYAAAWDTEVKRQLLPRVICGKNLVIYRKSNGECAALE